MAEGCRTRRGHAGWSLVVSSLTLDVGEWAQENFGECDLGDVRRTRRAVTVARQMAEHPDGSTPDQAEDGSDLKAMSRLFEADAEQVGERDGSERLSLRAVLAQQPLSGTYELSVGATKGHAARTARMPVRFARDPSPPETTDEIPARDRLPRTDARSRRNARGRSAERSPTAAPF